MTERSAERRAALAAAAAAVPLVVLTVLVAQRFGPLMRFDSWATLSFHSDVTDSGWLRFFQDVSTVCQPRIVGSLTGLLAVWLAVRRQWTGAWWVAGSLVLTALAWSLGKLWFERPRPDIPDQVSGWSYPSGHASEIGCAAAVLILALWPRMRRGPLRSATTVGLVGLALLVGLSRLAVGAHFPSDVVAGWLLGCVVTCALGALLGVVDPYAALRRARSVATEPQEVRRLAVVVNPTKSDIEGLRARLVEAAAAAGWEEPLWFETTVDDAGATMARQAVTAGAELVVAAGGDGTVRVVCSQMAGTGVPVGVVPMGTGNLLARNLGIPLGREAAIDVVLRGQDRPIDMVQIKGDDLETTRFAVMAGMGLDAAIMSGTADSLKRRVGWPAYVVAALRHLRYPFVRVQISIDDAVPVSRRARTVVVGNVGVLTGGIPLLPDARPDDGLLDVVVVAPRQVADYLPLLWRVLTRHPRTDARLDRFTGRSVVVTADSPTPRQLDGDTVGAGTEIRAEIEAGVLLLRVPR